MAAEIKYQMEDGVILAEGLEEAFIGVGRRCGQPDVAVYSVEKAIMVLVKRGATEEEAREHLEFNSIGAWVGPQTPVWIETMTLNEFYTLAASWAEVAGSEKTGETFDAEGWEQDVRIH